MHRLARAMTVLAAVVAASPALATDAEETAAETWFTDYATRRFGPPEAAYIHCANFFTKDDGGRVGDCWARPASSSVGATSGKAGPSAGLKERASTT